MKYGLFALITATLLFSSCVEKRKKSMSGNGEVTIEEFIDTYPEIKLPFTFSDTSFTEKGNDSLLIAQDVFYKFVPDSAVKQFFGQEYKPQFYAAGRFYNGKEETYLITRSIAKDKKLLLLSAYDKNNKFIACLPLIRADKSTAQSSVFVTIDPKFNINKNIIKRLPGEIVIEGNDVYILNSSSKKFMLVMTDSLGEATGKLINPIDTMPKNQRFAGDYGDGKANLISFRDGQRIGRLFMFVHLKNEKDGCEGELKGEVNFISPTTAEYRQGGDPCVLQFIFTNYGVKVQEVEGCGSRLGNLQCTFNGKYSKIKTPKSSAVNSEKPEAKPKVRPK